MKIGQISITKSGPLYFIADIASNHDGDINRAFKLIELAKESGAHAAKFQNFQAEKLVSVVGFDALGKLSNQATWKKSVFETYKDASISFDWTAKLKAKCDEAGIEYLTSPYDFESIDHVDPFVNAYKIGSGDITWLEIIEYIAKKRKPVIIATGASSLEDVTRSMETIQKYTDNIVLMQCNTNYTANIENFKYINLNVLKVYRDMYPDIILGLSDHTKGYSTVLGAIPLGAVVFEKHFTDDNSREGQDHKFAMDPKSWKKMVRCAEEVYMALGDGIKKVEDNEKESSLSYKRSIRAKYDIRKNSIITSEMLDFLRPLSNNGLPPYRVSEIIGKKVIKKIKKGEELVFGKLQ
ncbi:MAG: N-acetylneuraminate synthase family protein [Candidatus Parcubacteria bacterium]|nr:N-acetylneuraminate synthase family protein [Candidatus Parcubacteria bacterium]